MADFNSNFFPLELSFVDLTDGARSDWFELKLIKHLIDIDTINSLEYLFGLLKRMGRGVVSEVGKFLRHLGSNDISSVA